MTGTLTIRTTTPFQLQICGVNGIAYGGVHIQQSADLFLNKSASSGALSQVVGTNNGKLRWAIALGNTYNETGGNNGSGFAIANYSDGATSDAGRIALPFQIARASSTATFSNPIINGPSDERLKENILPIENALEKVLALKGVSFNRLDQENREIGLIAQEVQSILPEVIQQMEPQWDSNKAALYDDGGNPLLSINYPVLTALLIEAVKMLTARIEALENPT
jgi:hypothetical protein